MERTRKEMIEFMMTMERIWYEGNEKVVLKDFGYDNENDYLTYMKDVFAYMSDQDLKDNYKSIKP